MMCMRMRIPFFEVPVLNMNMSFTASDVCHHSHSSVCVGGREGGWVAGGVCIEPPTTTTSIDNDAG